MADRLSCQIQTLGIVEAVAIEHHHRAVLFEAQGSAVVDDRAVHTQAAEVRKRLRGIKTVWHDDSQNENRAYCALFRAEKTDTQSWSTLGCPKVAQHALELINDCRIINGGRHRRVAAISEFPQRPA